MKEIYLISPTTIKSYSNLNDNTHEKFIVESIKEAQTVGLQPVIGSALLNKLKENISAGTLSGQYKTLVDDYVSYYLIYQTVARLIPVVQFKVDNLGIFVTEDTNTQTLSFKDTFAMKDYYQSQADFYLKRLTEYLKVNRSLFPELKSTNDMTPQIDEDSNYYNCMWLGGKRGRRTV